MTTLTTLPKIAAGALLAVVAAIVVGVWLALGFNVHSLVTTVLVVWVLLLQLDRANVHEKADGASDVADQALGKANTAINHLTEPAGRGRHAKSASPAPQPEGIPS